MKRSSLKAAVLSSALSLLVFAGCATGRRPLSSALVLPVVRLPVTPPITPSGRASIPEQMMLVESVPSGAIIVVDGRPVGKAPLRLAVPATAQGFFLNDIEIRARFVATDATGVSRTAVEEFTLREKVPAALHFTPEGAQRTAQ
jgi:PEGA domain